MKQLLLKTAVFAIFSFLILVSDMSLYLKIIFLSILLLFVLPLRYEFFTKERVIRKLIAVLSGTLVFMVLSLFVLYLSSGDLSNPDVFSELEQFWGLFVMVFFMALGGFLVYGLPVSLLSDSLAALYPPRMAIAGLVHIGFGVLLIGELSVIPVICAVIVWIIDEILQKRTRKQLIGVNENP